MSVKVEEQWRFRKVRSERASKSAFAYKINQRLKGKEKSKLSYGYATKAPYSREVIVKITGGAQSKQGIKGAVYYMSHEGQLEIVDANGITYKGKEQVEDAVGLLQENAACQLNASQQKQGKLTHNMVFSASKMVGVKKEDMLKTAALTLKEKYPQNYFVMSYHDETKNPHVHVVLNIHKDTGERINIRKEDLRDIREGFCKNLITLGYDVEATRKYGHKLEEYKGLSSREDRNVYRVIDFGTASYQLDRNNDKNSYLVYKTSNDKEVKIWGRDLLNDVTRKNIKPGDFIRLKKVGQVDVKVPVYESDKTTILYWKVAKRNQWQVERIEDKLEFSKKDIIEEIKLNSSEQATKQLAQREKFNHEKNLLFASSHKKTFELKSELQHKPQKQAIRF